MVRVLVLFGSSRDEMGYVAWRKRERKKEERKTSDTDLEEPPSHFWSISPQLLHDEGVEE